MAWLFGSASPPGEVEWTSAPGQRKVLTNLYKIRKGWLLWNKTREQSGDLLRGKIFFWSRTDPEFGGNHLKFSSGRNRECKYPHGKGTDALYPGCPAWLPGANFGEHAPRST